MKALILCQEILTFCDRLYVPLTASKQTLIGSVSCSDVQLFAILWTVACQGPLSMEFSRQEY